MRNCNLGGRRDGLGEARLAESSEAHFRVVVYPL